MLASHLGGFFKVDAAPVAANAEVALEVHVRQQPLWLVLDQPSERIRHRIHLQCCLAPAAPAQRLIRPPVLKQKSSQTSTSRNFL